MAKAADERERPVSLGDALRRVWLETLNGLAEYGSLLVFSGLTYGVDVLRRSPSIPEVGATALLLLELVSASTMVLPKLIRAAGEIVQLLGIVGHDSVHALRFGTKRPRLPAKERK